ncbi:hypothetical protein LWI29_017966 [Acer saccharum]|uniref:6-phosphogluconate dehydrogenase NADP-binding domain-containing protein n=1 Tax=Acer saccharum TaxID=4024 RepID=A0AA39T2J9_ACESA|nr:hypothetical protein LWI29_017966 [Acer saccharum]
MQTPYPEPISPSKTHLGWIGIGISIGIMGSAKASRLITAGFSLTLYARNPSKALPLQSQGAHLANSPYDVT